MGNAGTINYAISEGNVSSCLCSRCRNPRHHYRSHNWVCTHSFLLIRRVNDIFLIHLLWSDTESTIKFSWHFATNELFRLCQPGTLSPSLVAGKAVLCWTGSIFETLEVQRAGGVATVIGNPMDGIGVVDRAYLIPATVVLSNETINIYNYIATDPSPTATLIPATTLIGTSPSPFMAAFTSRGPNAIEPNILKVISNILSCIGVEKVELSQ